jgi:trans-2,3-dihydro-3-hydroxyanthranilate isomerase
MRRYRFVTVDVFTATRFGGNPLAVFPEAFGLTDTEMQSLAAEFNLSETSFVLPPADPTNSARVRIFTPASELPFAGHPNVGTAWVLHAEGRGSAFRFEEGAGLVAVTMAEGVATVEAPQPLSLGTELPAALIARCCGLAEGDVLGAVEASVGNPFVLAELRPEALSRATPDPAAFREAAAVARRFSIYLHAADGAHRRARLFAPLLGVMEDPATGSAAAPLAGLLLSRSGASSLAFEIVQGVEMGRPSCLFVSARREAGEIRCRVGGGCVPMLRGEALL